MQGVIRLGLANPVSSATGAGTAVDMRLVLPSPAPTPDTRGGFRTGGLCVGYLSTLADNSRRFTMSGLEGSQDEVAWVVHPSMAERAFNCNALPNLHVARPGSGPE